MLALTKQAVTDLGEAPSLPRIAAGAAAALNLLYGRSAPLALALPGLSGSLRWDAAANIEARHQRYRFKLGAHAGQLGLDGLLASALLGERRSDLLPRELRYVLLAEALHTLADALERTLHLRFEWDAAAPDDAIEPAPHAAWFFIDTPERRARHGGFVQLDDAAALAALLPALNVPTRTPAAALDWLRVPLPFCLGSTRLSLREIGSISPGDIVSIEEWRSAGAALVVTAELGGTAGRELVGHAEGSRITLQLLKDKAMNRDIPAPASLSDDDGDTAGLPLDRLDALEVALRFEVGELSLSLGELKSIRAGHVFDLAQPLNRSTVRILAHGNVLGKGHLVAVGDRLGVRVAEFAPSEI